MRLELFEPFARTIVLALGQGILVSAALALLVLGITKLKPRPSATTRHVLWWLTLAASAILPIVSVAGSLGHIEHQRVPASIAGAGNVRVMRLPASTFSYTITAEPAVTPDAFAPLLAAVQRSLPTETLRYAGLAFFALWLLIAAGGMLSLTRSLVVLRRIKVEASPLDESVVRRLRRWRHSSRLGRAVALSVSNEVDVPVAVGFRLPTILLPAQVVETEEIADIDQIAMHEYAHLDRYDDWTNLLQRCIERLFWFNPVIAFVGRRISLEREIACDDWVVAQTGRAHRYATCLWKLVESSRLPAKPILAPGALLTPKQITVRIEQLLDARRNALPRLSPLSALVVGALCIGLIVVQVQRAPVIALVEPAPPEVAATVVKLAPAKKAAAKAASTIEAEKLAAERIKISEEWVKLEAARAQLEVSVAERTNATARVRQERLEWLPLPERKEPITIAVVAPDPSALMGMGANVQPFTPPLKRVVERSIRVSAFQSGVPRVVIVENEAPAALHAVTRASLEHCVACDLSHANLRGLDLSHIMLNGASLHGADLTGANLNGARLMGVDLREATLDGADLRNAIISGSDLTNSSFRNVRIDGIKIAATILSGMLAEGTNLRAALDRCQGCEMSTVYAHGFLLHLYKSKADLQKHQAQAHATAAESISETETIVDGSDETAATVPPRAPPAVNTPPHNKLD